MNKKTEIFGVGINDISIIDAVSWVSDAIRDKKKYLLFTPNPEFIVLAQEDREFKELLNKADLNIPDGVGLKLTGKIKNTTTGIDLMEMLCKEAASKGWKVGLLGGREGVAKKAAAVLKKRYPGINIAFAESGGVVPLTTNYHLPTVDIIFVAFGQGKQERWIYQNRSKISTKVFMGVGGAFDFISGNSKRAPRWVRALWFEWVFRLINEPWRAKRQLKILKFIWLVLTK